MKLKSWSTTYTLQDQASSSGPTSSLSGLSQTLSGLRLSLAQDAEISTPISSKTERTKDQKRESEKHKPRKKSRKTPSPTEELSHKTTTTTLSSDKPGPFSSVNTGPLVSRDDFVAKYTQNKLLCCGGFGSVYEGYRKDDNLPSLNRKTTMVPLEVALLLKVKPAAAENSAVVTLLDWCNLHSEAILVLERPVPCMDLVDFMVTRGYILQEHLAKVITKQLVDALIEVHSKGVFHRDIKLDNILIETSSDVPRVRLIDFGCGTVLTDGGYTTGEGTYEYLTPEWFQRRWYKAEPTTVWQLGVVLFAMLHGHLPFKHEREIVCEDPAISEGLSLGNS
ncbi:Serine/threonine-protein kinase pim-1 [Channa argus]|uniref:non-specific serine/threonine protein kinase n=1 Tax=Channa argus TaxID=215402 RepID=A0A6G1PMA4_CHAAH|nr:Serine/threonine-protein kinase pim-1 [Channa argus]